MMAPTRRFAILAVIFGLMTPVRAQRPVISTNPDTPFKLATFEAAGTARVGVVLGARLIDIERAHTMLVQELALHGTPVTPRDMRTLIERYETLKPHLHRIANYFASTKCEAPFVFEVEKVAILAPGSLQQKVANQADQDKEDPVVFAQLPRSCIIDPNEPYTITPGRHIDWEGELAIIIGAPAFKVAEAQAHEYVFGSSIMYDLSDRGSIGRRPLTGMFAGPNWFAGKSGDRSAPFDPFIVPKEFVANAAPFHIVTKVNGVVKPDGDTKNLIWDEAHMVRYPTSILTLDPGDAISSGTPDGVGAGRTPPEFLKPGNVVTIEIGGINTLRIPMRGAP